MKVYDSLMMFCFIMSIITLDSTSYITYSFFLAGLVFIYKSLEDRIKEKRK